MNIQFHIPCQGMPVSKWLSQTRKRKKLGIKELIFKRKEKIYDLTCLYFHNKHG